MFFGVNYISVVQKSSELVFSQSKTLTRSFIAQSFYQVTIYLLLVPARNRNVGMQFPYLGGCAATYMGQYRFAVNCTSTPWGAKTNVKSGEPWSSQAM